MSLYSVMRTTRRPASLISFGAPQSPITGDEFCEGGRWGRATEMKMTDDRLTTLSRFDARLTRSTLTSNSLHSDCHILYSDRNNGNVTSTRDGRDTSNLEFRNVSTYIFDQTIEMIIRIPSVC